MSSFAVYISRHFDSNGTSLGHLVAKGFPRVHRSSATDSSTASSLDVG